MTRERPLSILMLGLLNLIVAALCLFAGVAKTGRAFLLSALGPGQRENMYFGGNQERSVPIPDLETYLELEIPAYAAWETGAVIAILFAGVVLFAVSYGLLHMRPWVRGLALLYAVAMLVWQVAYGAFQITEVLPVSEIYYLDESWRSYSYMPSSTALARRSFLFFAWGPAAVLIGHAALVLLILWLPSVRAAFRGESDPSELPPAIPPQTPAHAGAGSV